MERSARRFRDYPGPSPLHVSGKAKIVTRLRRISGSQAGKRPTRRAEGVTVGASPLVSERGEDRIGGTVLLRPI
jgi:hypothetical protein